MDKSGKRQTVKKTYENRKTIGIKNLSKLNIS